VSALPPPAPDCAACAARDERIAAQQELIGELRDAVGAQAGAVRGAQRGQDQRRPGRRREIGADAGGIVRRCSPVNAWWGSFDLAVSLFSGRPAEPASGEFIMRNAGDAQQIEVGWWPGDPGYPRAAFFAYAYPAPAGFAAATLSPPAARWGAGLGEFVLDWDDARASADPHRAELEFGRSSVRHACAVCGWDPMLAASAQGVPPPLA
jgi:Family of unknown function (DUF5996)